MTRAIRPGRCRPLLGALRAGLASGGLALAVLAPLGCAPSEPANSALDYSGNAKQAYERALAEFEDENWEAATRLFEEVQHDYGYSRFARLAELRLADIAYAQQRFPEAATAYRGFASQYPNDPEVSYARYRVATSLYEQLQGNALMPPLYERDLGVVLDARASLAKFLDDAPNSKHAPELRHMLLVVTDLLTRHELHVARYYLRQDQFDAVVSRIDHALKEYPNSGLEPEALVLLGETYLKMKKPEDAAAAFRRVLTSYPTSPFTQPAQNFLDFMAAHPEGG